MQLSTRSLQTPVTEEVVVKKAQRRPHIYELDMVRALTAVLIITVHVLFFTKLLSPRLSFTLPNYAFMLLAHARAVFTFLTAYALVYVYYDKPFSGITFWKKRSLGILLPYCFWTCIYVWVNWHPATFDIFAHSALRSVLVGDASYQLYYILLTLQFYIIFPLFLLFLKKVKNHPWTVLAISFAIQMVCIYFDYKYLLQPGGAMTLTGFWATVVSYQDRYIILYQFYFILGGIAAIYQPQIRDFLTRHGKIVLLGMAIAVVLLLAHYILQVLLWHESFARATAFMQPMIVIYNTMLTIFIAYIAFLWARKRNADGKPYGYKFWHMLSDATFGVYLVHALFISYAMDVVIPKLPSSWPAQLRVVLIWVPIVICSYLFSIILMKIPVVSRLVGRKEPLPKWLLHKRHSPEEQVKA